MPDMNNCPRCHDSAIGQLCIEHLRAEHVRGRSITLFKSRGSWIARFDDPEVVALMGTCDIPTPFTDTASAGLVAEEIGRRNPGHTIIVAPDPWWYGKEPKQEVILQPGRDTSETAVNPLTLLHRK